MTKKEVVEFFGGNAALAAERIGISAAAFCKWNKYRHGLPERLALKVEKATNGALMADSTKRIKGLL